MPEQSLPKTYRGYSTEELLGILKMRMSHQSLKGVPVEMISAMDNLSAEFLLTPEHRHSPRGQAILAKRQAEV